MLRLSLCPSFYLWNHSSTAVVNGQTFLDWFIHDYMFNTVGSSPLVSGFFWVRGRVGPRTSSG